MKQITLKVCRITPWSTLQLSVQRKITTEQTESLYNWCTQVPIKWASVLTKFFSPPPFLWVCTWRGSDVSQLSVVPLKVHVSVLISVTTPRLEPWVTEICDMRKETFFCGHRLCFSSQPSGSILFTNPFVRPFCLGGDHYHTIFFLHLGQQPAFLCFYVKNT
jgi:hypothetical protein